MLIRGKCKILLTDEGILYLLKVKEILRLLNKAEKDIQIEVESIAGAIAMVCDWTIRAMFYIQRYRSGKWKKFELI